MNFLVINVLEVMCHHRLRYVIFVRGHWTCATSSEK